MKSLILVSMLFLTFTSFMPLNAQWAKVYGMNFYDIDYPFSYNLSEVYSIHQTNDGGYIIAGGVNYEIWILKLDSAGGIEWQRAYEENDYWDDAANSIQQTSDGGYIVSGYTDLMSDNWSNNYIWILKLDSAGGIEWQRAYGEDGPGNTAYSIQQTTDGGYIVACGDFRVLKLDSAGNIEWQRDYGGNDADIAYSIQQTSDGGYIVAGETQSFGSSWWDILVLKLDSTGGITWQRAYGGSEFDYTKSIQQTSDGGFIVGGGTSSFGSGYFDIWVLKLDSMGNIDWQKTYGGSGFDHANSIQQTNDGEYIVIGRTSSFGNGGDDIWALKLNPAGGIEWQRTYGRSHDDSGIAAQQISDGGYIVVGKTEYKVPFQEYALDAFIWRIVSYKAIVILKISPNGDIDPSCELIGSSNASVLDTGVTPYEINIIPQDIDFTPLDTNIVPHDTEADVNRLWPDPTIFDLSISSTSGGYTEPAEFSHYTFVTGKDISIKAILEERYRFNGWTGDVPTGHENDNPITITIDSDKSVTANFSQIPSEENCFIATAAYGLPLHPHVKILREFRDKYLIPSKLGRTLIDFYNKYSPFFADLVAKHKVLRIGVRIGLMPIVAFSYSMVHFGPVITVILIVLNFGLPILFFSVYRWKKRRVKARIPWDPSNCRTLSG